MGLSRGNQRSNAIDSLVDSMQKGTTDIGSGTPRPKTPWERAGMTREEYNRGIDQRNQELELERLRSNQAHPGNH